MTAVGQLYADFSYTKPTTAQLRAAGYVGAIGYLSVPDDQSGNGKNISAGQVASYQATGIDVLLVWETTAQRALGGAPAGQSDGTAAFNQARGRGLPLTSVLFFNIGDFAATPSQIATIGQYLAAAIAQCPGQLVGAYGTGYILDQLAAQFPSVIWWENAMNDQGESGSTVSPNAYLYQRVRSTHPIGGTDENVVCRVWAAPIPPTPPDPPKPPAPPPPTIEESDMITVVENGSDGHRHVYVYDETAKTVTHWWQNSDGTGGWNTEVLPGTA